MPNDEQLNRISELLRTSRRAGGDGSDGAKYGGGDPDIGETASQQTTRSIHRQHVGIRTPATGEIAITTVRTSP